jgi:hypothetical protein
MYGDSSGGVTVGSLLEAVKAARQNDGQRSRRLLRAEWLVLAAYLLAAIWVTYHIWASPTTKTPSFNTVVKSDIYLNAWFMRYAATALSHGHLPALITTAVNAPQGINAMWNTSLLIPSMLLAPITLLAGPIASLTVLLTLGFAGSAATMFIVLRRWNASITAAAIGGALYAFSPALMVASEDHYHMQFAVLPPLIIDAAIRVATGRSSPVRGGIWLGVLVATQMFIAEELLVDTALAGGVIMFFLLVSRPRAVLDRGADAFAGVGIAIGVVLVICAYPFWVQFHGPLTEHGSPWHIASYGNHVATFLTAPLSVLIHSTPAYNTLLHNTASWPSETYGYVGWPLLIIMVALPIVFWSDIKIRVMSLSFFGLAWLSMGGHRQRVHGIHIPAGLFPWHYLGTLPLLNEIVVNRLSIMSDGAAAVALAFAADRVIGAVRQQDAWRKPAFASIALLAFAAVVVPVIPRPVLVAKVVPPPAGWRAVISGLHLPASGSVLVLPLDHALTMEWQAVTNEPISIVGGYCVAPDRHGKAAQCNNSELETRPQQIVRLRTSWLAGAHVDRSGPSFKTFEVALRQWKPAALIVPPGFSAKLTNYMIAFFGPPTVQKDGVYGWRLASKWWLHLPAQTQPASKPAAHAPKKTH